MRSIRKWGLGALAVVASMFSHVGSAEETPPARKDPDIELFFQAAAKEREPARQALEEIAARWRDGYTPMLIDLARLLRPARTLESEAPMAEATPELRGPGAIVDPGSPVRQRLLQFLKKQTGQRFGDNLDGWRRWMWSQPYAPHPDYGLFKARLYGFIDPRMARFFPPDVGTTIRLDEIDWGGVKVNGIPPLDHPATVTAGEAGFLKERHVVFGMMVNGEARAYPRRILGWHELVRDSLGGLHVTLVFCTLCGAAVSYDSEVDGTVLTLGTSGLLFRSNKLMFDEQTSNLWSSLSGEPVVGTRAGSGQRLRRLPVVVTTWKEWKAAHPNTTVLSPLTGYDRDYSEGAAYRDYFRTDRLMFQVPHRDDRLRNKDEVVALLPRRGTAEGGRPLAVEVDFLARNPIYHHVDDERNLVFVTTPGGATRVYEADSVRLIRRLDDGRLEDSRGHLWKVTEERLLPQRSGDTSLPRVPTNRVFWFGWRAQYPDTELVHGRSVEKGRPDPAD